MNLKGLLFVLIIIIGSANSLDASDKSDRREKAGQERISWRAWFKECIQSVTTKSIPEAINDPAFYQSQYQQRIQQIRKSMLSGKISMLELEQDLNEVSEFIGIGTLVPPHHHIKTLGRLQENIRRRGYGPTLHKILESFIADLHEQKPEFHKQSFLQDSVKFLSGYNTYTAQKKRNQDLRKLFAFYAKYQDPLDYAESLDKFCGLADANQKIFELSRDDLMKINSSKENAWSLYKNKPFFEEELQKAQTRRKLSETATQIEKQMDLLKRLAAKAKEAEDRKKTSWYMNVAKDAHAHASKVAKFANENKFGLTALALTLNLPAVAAAITATPPRPPLATACDGTLYDCISAHTPLSSMSTFNINPTDITTLVNQPDYAAAINCSLTSGNPGACMPNIQNMNNAGLYSEISTFNLKPQLLETTLYNPTIYPNYTGIDFTDWPANETLHKEVPFQVLNGVSSAGVITLPLGNFGRYGIGLQPNNDVLTLIKIYNSQGTLGVITSIRKNAVTNSSQIVWQGVITNLTVTSYPPLSLTPQYPSLSPQAFPPCVDYYSCMNFYDPNLLNTTNIANYQPIYDIIKSFTMYKAAKTSDLVRLGNFFPNDDVRFMDFDATQWPTISVTSYDPRTYPSRHVCTKNPFTPTQYQQVCADVSPTGTQTNVITTFQPRSILTAQRYMAPGDFIQHFSLSQGGKVRGTFILTNSNRQGIFPRTLREGIWTGATTPALGDNLQLGMSTTPTVKAIALANTNLDSFPMALSSGSVVDDANCGSLSWPQWVAKYVTSDPFWGHNQACFSQQGLLYSDPCQSLMQESQESYMRFDSYFRNPTNLSIMKYALSSGGSGVETVSSGTLAANTVTHFISRYGNPTVPNSGAVVMQLNQDLGTNAVTVSFKAIMGASSGQCTKKRSIDMPDFVETTGHSVFEPKIEFISRHELESLQDLSTLNLDNHISTSDWWRAIQEMRSKNLIQESSHYEFEIRKDTWLYKYSFTENVDGFTRISVTEPSPEYTPEPTFKVKRESAN